MSSEELYLPNEQMLHVESVDAVPTVYPNPAAHLLWLCGWHAPPLVENVPCAHELAQAASVLEVPGVRGSPAAQVGVEWVRHTVLSSVAEYVPTTHSRHDESIDADPIVYPAPAGHDVTVQAVHAAASAATENVSDTHGKQDASFVASPGKNPAPAEQTETVCSAHGSALTLDENLPLEQVLQPVSVEAEPSMKPFPTAQLDVEYVSHLDLSSFALNVLVQTTQLASTIVEPSM